MSEMQEQNTPVSFVLPPSVVTRVDVSRLITELERVDNELTSRAAKEKSGVGSGDEVSYSEQLTDFLTANQLEIGADNVQRMDLIKRLRSLKAKAPVVHITFATSADTESLQKIVTWLRQSVHPQSVLMVGLQPSLIGGAYVRTPNHVHDFSLRAQLAGHRDIITREVEALSGGN